MSFSGATATCMAGLAATYGLRCSRVHDVPPWRMRAMCCLYHCPTHYHPGRPLPLFCSRVMLKVSGEALEGAQGFGIDPTVLQSIASEVAAAASEGVQIAIVVGGGK